MGGSVCLCSPRLGRALPAGVAVCPGAESGRWDLCAMSPEGAARIWGRELHCRTLLGPEGIYHPMWQTAQVVSYGLGRRSSLTLSSMGGCGVLCVQRALRDRRGQTVEEQELPLLEKWNGFAPQDKLLLAGSWLLWGGLPEI